MYAVFHSPAYRTRYAEFLKIDFPRLPLTSNLALFTKLCKLGEELVGLHLMEKFGKRLTGFRGKGSDEVDFVKYLEPEGLDSRVRGNDNSGRVAINDDQYFEGVTPEVWNFHIGGYQVAHKWLKDRKGRKLSFDDIEHYHHIISALSETIRLMREIDEVITEAGGFPLK
jgi:predicted helicase